MRVRAFDTWLLFGIPFYLGTDRGSREAIIVRQHHICAHEGELRRLDADYCWHMPK